ncbi:MAG: hypothetical protein RIB93_05660 [Coleofasciculus sp. D1-CHI-01]|jgi:hypothetical protein|uniref:Uncharacterized protein n=1 Tax=Coleofasciculus chthonoplastes PCC 7420 TaxID=118168 RepID=B4VWD8_9CYAN|nr:hypothetical protein [Coleofasciculus chthonoplastes]EDX73762.1 hypothetical protein MC7420_6810 [Coleofasciculus chthonoplastes PCC 7420]
MSEYVLARIEAIQQELEALRQLVAHQVQNTKRQTHLKGLWKDVEITDKDIEAAKQAVFRDAYNWQD